MQDFRFPRDNRLTRPELFQPVFDQPDYRAGQPHFLILARENGLDRPRLGLVVGRKRARRAVDRALIKRVARESFRLRSPALTGLDVIVLLRRSPGRPDRTRIREELEDGWNKLLAKRAQA